MQMYLLRFSQCLFEIKLTSRNQDVFLWKTSFSSFFCRLEDIEQWPYIPIQLWLEGVCPRHSLLLSHAHYSGFLWAFKSAPLVSLTRLILRSCFICIVLSLVIKLPLEGLVGLQTVQAIKKLGLGCPGMCSLGEPILTWKLAASNDSDTALPTPSFALGYNL